MLQFTSVNIVSESEHKVAQDVGHVGGASVIVRSLRILVQEELVCNNIQDNSSPKHYPPFANRSADENCEVENGEGQQDNVSYRVQQICNR